MLNIGISGIVSVLPILCAAMSFNTNAESEFHTLIFKGEIAEPSCYSDFSTISCYDQSLNKFTTETIQSDIRHQSISSNQVLFLRTEFKQINNLTLNRLEQNERILSINYN